MSDKNYIIRHKLTPGIYFHCLLKLSILKVFLNSKIFIKLKYSKMYDKLKSQNYLTLFQNHTDRKPKIDEKII